MLGGPADRLAGVHPLPGELVEGLRLLKGPGDVGLQARRGVGVIQVGDRPPELHALGLPVGPDCHEQ
eukprot:14605775-Alexandrium_andersonii.AAC.1